MLGFNALSEAPISAQAQGEDASLVLSYLENTSVLYEPTVQIEWLLEPPLLTNTQTFYTHALGLEGELPTLVDGDTLYAPGAAYVGQLPLLTISNTLYSPEITGFNVYMPSWIVTGKRLRIC